MKTTLLKGGSVLVILMLLFTGCSMTSQAKNFNGLPSADGKAIAHLSTTNYAIHLLFSKPLAGDATLEKTVADFTEQAKIEGASKVRIVQSSSMSLWYLLGPITIVLTPVITNVAGEAL